jgi:hypothetical protein
MSLRGRLSLAFAATVLLAACGGNDAPAPAQQRAAAPAAVTNPPASTGAMSAVVAGDFGVKECDDYLRKYLACIDSKVPEATRAMVRQSLDQTKASWKQIAATPQGKAGLANACVQAEASTKQAMTAYGCTW